MKQKLKKFFSRLMGNVTVEAQVVDENGNTTIIDAEVTNPNDSPNMLKRTVDNMTKLFERQRQQRKAISLLLKSGADMVWLMQNAKMSKDAKESYNEILKTAMEKATNPMHKFQIQLLWQMFNCRG